MNKKWQVNITLKMFAILAVIPIVFSTFFGGYEVISNGLQVNAPVSVSIFDYVSKNDIFLAISFVCIVLMILLILAIAILSIIDVYKKRNTNFLGILLSSFEIILSITIFVCTLAFCLNNSVYSENTSLKYELGTCTILCFVFGLIFGIFSLISYTIKIDKKDVKTKNSKNV